MANRLCANCKTPVRDKDTHCHHCGTKYIEIGNHCPNEGCKDYNKQKAIADVCCGKCGTKLIQG